MEIPLKRKLQDITGGSVNTGWMCDEVCRLLYALVQFYRPQVVIQTGHLWGSSALVVLDAIRNTDDSYEPTGDPAFDSFVRGNSPPRHGMCEVHSIDPNPAGVPEWAKGNALLGSEYPNFNFHRMGSSEWFRHARILYRLEGRRVMGVVDGDHSEEGCRGDLEGLNDLGAGLIIVDDTCWIPDIGRVASEFASLVGYDYLNLPWYNGVGILVKRLIG